MEDSGRRSPKYLIFLLVLGLHGTLMILLVSFRYRVSLPPPARAIELFFVPSINSPKSRAATGLQLPPDTRLPPLQPNAITLPPIWGAPTGDASGNDQIDWEGEARRAAAAAAQKIAPGSRLDSEPSDGSNWWPAPEHHAGEQTRLDTGEWMVWISDHCYQISSGLPSPNGSLGASLPTTICPQPSNEPRGDLFKDLPEYKKHHPNE